ncbi:ABC transporter substrate-binding protein, partial [Pseudonocardia sp.]|uniref:ABC transporter substrate-binding protein n=1 Tax=Pseudonocardia sp. TaxID=60912 RepID=UPI003D105CDF
MQLSHRGLPDGDHANSRTGGFRLGVVVAAFLAALAMVAGCGSTPAAAPTDEPVTVTHKFGETKIPANPKNVVTVGWNDQDFVLALDVVPVATREWFDNYNNFPWVKEATGGKGVTTLGGDGIDYESIAAAKPDLIFAIYETIDKPTYDRLSQIAPTV